jgi:predicted DNA-binding transcriptional regulator YafY
MTVIKDLSPYWFIVSFVVDVIVVWLPVQLNVSSAKERALLRVRKNRGHQLRSLGTLVDSGEEWDVLSLPILDLSWLLRSILWHRDDVIVVEPISLRESVISSLNELRAIHG